MMKEDELPSLTDMPRNLQDENGVQTDKHLRHERIWKDEMEVLGCRCGIRMI